MCSDGLREKERSVGRSRSGHHGVTHLVQCPYMRTVTAESSETPVKAEAGRAACRKNLFSSCLAYPPKLLFTSIFLFALFLREKQNQSHNRGCVKGSWSAKDLQGFCRETSSTSTLRLQEKALHQLCSGLEGQGVTWSLDPCICRSSPLILTVPLKPKQNGHEKQDCDFGAGVATQYGCFLELSFQLGCQFSSIQECKHGLTQVICVPQHSA